MITYTHPTAGNLPFKPLVAKQQLTNSNTANIMDIQLILHYELKSDCFATGLISDNHNNTAIIMFLFVYMAVSMLQQIQV